MNEFRRILRLREPFMRGEDIRALQRKIGATTDGIYGPNTEKLVKVSQHLLGLETTGVVTEDVWNSIRDDLKIQNGSLVVSSGNDTVKKLVDFAKIAMPASLILLLILIGVKAARD